jgi:hypothetical protein
MLMVALPLTAQKKQEMSYGYSQIGFDFLGKQNVKILSSGKTVSAQSQIGINAGTYMNWGTIIHPTATLGFRQVKLSNIDSIGATKHLDLYIMAGARYFPDSKFYNKRWSLTFSAMGGLNLRGAGIADQMAFDLHVTGGMVYSLTKGYPSNMLIFEVKYMPLGSDAISTIELLPSYIFNVSFIQKMTWKV